MTWISFVCLLALSSAVLAGPYGRYGASVVQPMETIMTAMRSQQPVFSGYGQTELPPPPPRTLMPQGYGAGIRSIEEPQTVQPVAPTLQLTEADMACRGQQPETVIPIENSRKFIVCLDESKGVIQSCPQGLFYHEGSRRCERTLGPLPNACVSQPCLNGGQCAPVDSHYQCQCAPGFDGSNCELDARICQTQQPCGSSPDTRCQSFRLGASLNFVCIFQGGFAYGFGAGQLVQSPCQGVDGPQALANSNKGFIICDGERMFIESCPGGTLWDDLNKACVWPDTVITTPKVRFTGQRESNYGGQTLLPPPPRSNEYGGQIAVQPIPPPPRSNEYGGQIAVQPLPPPTRSNEYGSQTLLPPPPRSNEYGGQIAVQPLPPPTRSNEYGGQIAVQPLPPPPRSNEYGGQIAVQPLPPPPRSNEYGGQITLPPPPPKTMNSYSYGTLPPPPRVNTYGSRIIVQPPPPQKFVQPSGY